jgi:serine/threonine protein kinase
LTCPDDFSAELKDLLFKLLDKDPSKRPTVVEMMSHKWFNPVFESAEQAFEGDDREDNVDDNFLLNEEDGK